MKIAVIGLGLIGGSFAKAIKAKTFHTVAGYDASQAVLHQAIAFGAIDEVAQGEYSDADIVLLALYPQDTVDFLKTHQDSFQPGALVVDLCGVKRYICRQVRELFAGSSITFIGGHPMAGKENSGFVNSTDTLFEGASMILTPYDGTPDEKLTLAGEFFRSVGFGHIQITTDEHHDEMIAFTSQLAHVLSSSYVQCPTASQHMGFSAGSFQDLTRVAKLNETMWTELFLLNSDYLSNQIGDIIDKLEQFRQAIAGKDQATLHRMLREGRQLKEKLGSA